MSQRAFDKKRLLLPGITRREFIKTVAYGSALCSTVGFAAEETPPEPADLDVPTPWQEGDPQPRKAQVPAVEREQTSGEDPPAQPMDDDRGEPPSPQYQWVYGYWWWTAGTYVWVPGYWAIPPEQEYEYLPGYWGYRGARWAYVRGGWVVVGTTTIVAYAVPRSVVWVYVIPAPARIARRNRRWRRYPHRRLQHRPYPPHTPRQYPRRGRPGRRR